jgi:signal transduction histidine kinase
LTARVGSEATLEAYAHGADDFVAKPFHPRVLLARIQAQLKLRALGLQTVHQEKLVVVGTLAAGILHEVRNPVNAIMNASRVISEKSVDETTIRKLVNVVLESAERINGITTALDVHARPAEADATSACDVCDGLSSTIRLLDHRLTDVKVHCDFESGCVARIAAGPLNQVFLNILDNSQSMGARNIWLKAHPYKGLVRISASDDGPGVPHGEEERIFNPFYTKRHDKAGTGLGLYLSRKIIEDHGGTLHYEHRKDGGARFVIEIPSVGTCESSMPKHDRLK